MNYKLDQIHCICKVQKADNGDNFGHAQGAITQELCRRRSYKTQIKFKHLIRKEYLVGNDEGTYYVVDQTEDVIASTDMLDRDTELVMIKHKLMYQAICAALAIIHVNPRYHERIAHQVFFEARRLLNGPVDDVWLIVEVLRVYTYVCHEEVETNTNCI
ncbi:hypothetical protein Ancab_020678 [Ancistrocladus abbreviatus]